MERADAEAIALGGGEPARELVVRLLDGLDQMADAAGDVVRLRERVEELERSLNRTSRNSSVAPSSDSPLTRQQRRALARERAKKQLQREVRAGSGASRARSRVMRARVGRRPSRSS